MEDQILVTGASGYIATHIIQQLLKAGNKVRGTVRSLENEEKVKPVKNLCPDAKYPLELVEADLNDADCWLPAVKDCSFVMHVASPFVIAKPKDENDLIKPAVDGTLNVLRACKEARTIKRVILTSSIVAISNGTGGNCNEEIWNESDKAYTAYVKSKILAERAAWDFMKELTDDEKFDLVVLNPVYVMGPVLCGPTTASMELIKRLLERQMPMVPRLHFNIVDVRDVAAAHIISLTNEAAVNHRHILSAKGMWTGEVAELIANEFKSQGYNVPTKNAPYALMWLSSLFDKEIRAILPILGKETKVDNNRMKSVLGIEPIPIEKTIIEMCYSMIEAGKVKKTQLYKGNKTVEVQDPKAGGDS